MGTPLPCCVDAYTNTTLVLPTPGRDEFEVVAIDMRGYGESSKPEVQCGCRAGLMVLQADERHSASLPVYGTQALIASDFLSTSLCTHATQGWLAYHQYHLLVDLQIVTERLLRESGQKQVHLLCGE